MRKWGIFAKVFVYTTLFSALLVGAATALLLQQLLEYRSQLRIQSIVDSYDDSFDRLQEGEDRAQALRVFDLSQSFEFYVTDRNGDIVYKTSGADEAGIPLDDSSDSTIMIRLDRELDLHAFTGDVLMGNYGRWAAQAALIMAAMLAACVAGSLLFARGITRPIRSLADSTHRMANLEEIAPLPERGDELGALARDIHSMYAGLKDRIFRETELAEAQRHFFAAASHELKTPIAATSAMLEGMLANVSDYSDHPKYLRECLELTDAQGRIASEMLEIVSLSDGRLVPSPATLDLNEVVSGLLPGFQALAEAGGLTVSVNIPAGETIRADRKMLERALSNVILNAVQNTPQGGEVRIGSEPLDEGYRLRVLNTGARIDEAALPRLFDPFCRADKARGRGNGGKARGRGNGGGGGQGGGGKAEGRGDGQGRRGGRSGLGLTIVRKTLEALGIPFALENSAEGVVFRMDLPRA